MKVRELVDKLKLKVLSGENGLDRDIDGCYVSDLLSDVMGNAEMGNVWVTLSSAVLSSKLRFQGIPIQRRILPDKKYILQPKQIYMRFR